MSKVFDHITIRPDEPADQAAIVRLAALDSAAVPPSPFLLVEVDGELRAALSLATRQAIADPFHRTLHLVAMLREYAGAAGGRAASSAAYRRRTPGRLAPDALPERATA